MHNCLSYNGCKTIHSNIQHVHHNSLNIKYDCRSEIGKNTYLIKNSSCNQLRHCNVPSNHRPACSLISQQRCHPWAGHDSSKDKGHVGLHIAEGHNQTNQHRWVYQAINNWPSQQSLKTKHYLHAAKQSLHSPVKKAKTTGDSPKRKVRHSSSLQGNSELFLALTWPKKLSFNPKPGYSSSHKHTMNDSSNPQSQNRETQPTDWKSIAHSTHNSSR